MSQLALSLLGQVQFSLDGRPLTAFESDKARALLIYLALDAGRPHRRGQLSALFWAEHDEAGAAQNLRKTLSRLRHTLQNDDFLLTDPQSIQFNRDSDYTVDVLTFRALLAEAQRHAHISLEGCKTCMPQLTRAIQLYRGNFLSGFALKDSPEFDEWVALQREHLRLQAIEALSALTAYHERCQDYAAVRAYARQQLELEPWLESAHRHLMRALALGGNRTAALAQYKVCRQALEKELGVEPEAETTALYKQIKAWDGTLTGEGDNGALAMRLHALSPLYNLPPRMTSFVGREADMAHVGQLLRAPDCRLLTLVGPGGSGKTRLAVEVARAEATAFRDGVCFVPLASIGSADVIASAVASALGMTLLSTQDVKAQVLAFLRDKEMLLIFDNFEHLIPAAWLVSEKLRACPRLRILVTSREVLHLYGEHEFAVQPLATPKLGNARGMQAHALSRFPAVELFVQRSQAANPIFRFDDETAAAVGEVCDRLDGLPLAIELAAARSRLFSPREMAAQLTHRLSFLKTGARDLPQRQQTLWHTIDWSHGLLSPGEQTLFRRLAVFSSGFTLAAAQAVCNADGTLDHEVLNTLEALMDKSLIYRMQEQTGGSKGAVDSRFDMLETLWEYARTKLGNESDEATCVRNAHLCYFCELAEDAEHKMQRGEMGQSIAHLEREHDNLRAALAWAYERGEMELGLRLTGALSRFWRICGFLDEGNEWSARMLAAGAQAAPAVRARALLGAAEIARISGQDDPARQLTESSLALYRELGDRTGTGNALTVLGAMAHYAQSRAQATELLAEAEELFRAASDERGLGYALLWLGDVRLRLGDLDWATRCFAEALPIFRRLGDRIYTSWALGGLGDVARLRANYAEAEAALHEALHLHVEVNNRAGMPFPIEALALVAVGQAQYERAAVLWGIVEALRQAINAPTPASYQTDYAPHIAEARTELGEAQFEESTAAGRAMSFEQAIEFALKSTDITPESP